MSTQANLSLVAATAESRARPQQGELFDQAGLIRDLVAAEPESEAARLALALVDEIEQMARKAEEATAHATRRAERALARVADLQTQVEVLRRELRDMHDARAQVLADRDVLRERTEVLRERTAAQAAHLMALEERQRKSRHGARQPRPVIPDREGGPGRRPDPSAATTEAEFMAALQAYREWAGNRSVRQIADGSGGRISPTKVHLLLKSTRLPVRLDQLIGIIRGCGGTDEDLAAWATAWRALRPAAAAAAAAG